MRSSIWPGFVLFVESENQPIVLGFARNASTASFSRATFLTFPQVLEPSEQDQVEDSSSRNKATYNLQQARISTSRNRCLDLTKAKQSKGQKTTPTPNARAIKKKNSLPSATSLSTPPRALDLAACPSSLGTHQPRPRRPQETLSASQRSSQSKSQDPSKRQHSLSCTDCTDGDEWFIIILSSPTTLQAIVKRTFGFDSLTKRLGLGPGTVPSASVKRIPLIVAIRPLKHRCNCTEDASLHFLAHAHLLLLHQHYSRSP